MTDAQVLQNLLVVQETMAIFRIPERFGVLELKEVIAEIRRRIELEDDRS